LGCLWLDDGESLFVDLSTNTLGFKFEEDCEDVEVDFKSFGTLGQRTGNISVWIG